MNTEESSMKKNKISLIAGVLLLVHAMTVMAADAFIQKKSPYGVGQTLDRLESVLNKKGITVFARVDHAAGARKAGFEMADTQLLIFGNPKMGTPLIKEQRLTGLDLPLKVLAWKDEQGQTWIAYTDPAELQARHGIKNQKVIDKMKKALNGMTNKALETK